MQLSTLLRDLATDLLQSLDSKQSARAIFPFELEGERTNWFYTPTDHGGLPLNAMTPRQQERVHRLLAASLSPGGHHTVNLIMGLENILAAESGFRSMQILPQEWRSRDPGRYCVAIFGDPGAEPWGWRFGGHHVSLSYTLVAGEVRVLPSFLGADPVTSQGVGPNALRLFAGEEELGRALVRSLNDQQRVKAIIAPNAPWDHVSGRAPRLIAGLRPAAFASLFREVPPPELQATLALRDAENALSEPDLRSVEFTFEPKGLPVAELDAGQRELFDGVLRQYVERLPAEIASEAMARACAIEPTRLTFAWAGGIEPGDPHYYRIQGDTLLVEYDKVQNDANHIHTIWRDPTRDFGRDLLAEHYAQAHG